MPPVSRAEAQAPGSAPRPRPWRGAVRLAWLDFRHEWLISLCLALALAAVLTPLLVLFGLKSGIVTTLTERLKADPRNLELSIKGNQRLEGAWIEALGARPEVGFLVPRTRTLAATLDLMGAAERSLPEVDLIPTAAGDPLLGGVSVPPKGLTEAILTHTAALKLGVGPGDAIEGVVRRRLGGEGQSQTLGLQVLAVLPETALGRDALFVDGALLLALEDYRDGLRVAALGVTEGGDPPAAARSYAGVRLYARDLDQVAGLSEHLRAEGLDVRTSAAEIERVRAIDRVLGFLFAVIAGVGVTGFLLSLATSLWANVERKRRDLGLLRLVGLGRGPLMAFPATQAVLIALGGLVVSALLYLGVAALFNAVLAAGLERGEFVCRLQPGDGLIAAALTLAFALGASIGGGYRAAKTDPAESLREA